MSPIYVYIVNFDFYVIRVKRNKSGTLQRETKNVV